MKQKAIKGKIYIGIDIGLQGAIAELNKVNDSAVIYKMPLVSGVADYHQLHNILKAYQGINCHVVFEDLHAIFKAAAKSTFNFAHICGATEMACISLGLPFTKVKAKDWQAEMFVGIKKIAKQNSSRNDTKAMSILACKRLFPNVSLLPSPKHTKPSDGIADALMMAAYCRRKFA